MQLAGHTRVTSPDFRGDRLNPESWVSERGELLRELRGRRVYRAEVGGQRVVVKEYSPVRRDWGRRFRDLLRPKAQTEAENALAVAARGVPVVEPLAWARLDDGRQILVLKEEIGALTVQQLLLGGGVTGHERHELCRRVGDAVARLHNAGIRHRDPHAGNLLVRPDGSILFADAWDLRPGDYLSAGERARGLAGFAPFFLTHGNMVDLLLFWGEYGRRSEFLPEQLEELRDLVLEHVPDAFRKLVGRRTRRTRRLGEPVAIGRFTGVRTGEIPPAELERAVAMALDRKPGPHVLKRSPTAWTFRVGDDYVAKVFLPKKVSRPLRDLIQGTRAERALEAAEACRHRGLRTPEVVAVLRDGVLPTHSILVMRRVVGSLPVEEALRGMDPPRARATAVRLGRTLRRMHDWGLRHRDLKKDNLLLDPATGDVTLLDLDGMRQTRGGRLDWGRRARDLAGLAGSLLDGSAVPTGLRLRALDAYCGPNPPPGHEPGAFAREVVELAEQARQRRIS